MAFALDPSIPVSRLRDEFAQQGRIQIKPFLEPSSADRLREHLIGRDDWRLVLNAGDQVFEIERGAFLAMEPEKREALDRLVAERARNEFQYRFETIRVADDRSSREAAGTLLDEFAEFMCSEPVLTILREITGKAAIRFADAQATCYRTGHFLTRHDDDVAGKNREAAYVLGLTPNWRAEWGGLLMFHSANDRIEEAFAPGMGALRIFSVPAPHSVSYVSPLAPDPRLSVTGWLRSRLPA